MPPETTPQQLTGSDVDVFFERHMPQTTGWLYDTLQGFCNDETAVDVTWQATASGAVFTVKVAQQDMGKVIGKSGTMARHLRSMLLARGRKLGVLFTLEIEQPGRSAPIDPIEYNNRLMDAVLGKAS